jgi:sugar (pentulose or hexulose) kinase
MYRGKPSAICVSSQLGICMLDVSGRPVTSALTWEHGDATGQAGELAAAISDCGVDIGRQLVAEASGAQLLWLRKREPEAYAQISSVLSIKDYLNYRLTGRIATDVVHAAYSGLFDLRTSAWDQCLFAHLDLPMAAMPEILGPTNVLGTVATRVAQILDIPARTQVVVGAPDGTTSMIGLGVSRPGVAGDISGTSEVLFAFTRDRVASSGRLVSNPHPDGRSWLVGGPMTSTGRSIAWIGRTFGVSIRRLVELASATPAGSNGLLFMPGLGGDRTPFWEAAPRGAFVGLSLTNGRGDLARAAFEGVAFLTRRVMAECARVGAPIEVLHLAGPSASSEVVRQLRADILGVAVEVASDTETGLIGSAALAISALGLVSLEEAAIRVEPKMIRHEPTEAYRSLYNDLYGQWEATADAIAAPSNGLANWRTRYPTWPNG